MSNFSQLVFNRDETPKELIDLLDTLAEEYPITDCGQGLKLEFHRIESDETISRVTRSTDKVLIEYNSIAAASRGIGAALSGLEGEETTPFKTLGILLDVSRNMVMTIDHLKKWFRRLSLSGYNLLMLYTEDIYQLPNEPFFGYMRGAYSMDEIKELDRYAKKLGIELAGRIQALGHLEQIIRWRGAYSKVSDTASVLMVDEPETYKLLEKMIAFWSEALSSRRLHLGMDETHDLGRGKFLDHHGFEEPFELYNRHLAKVNEICRSYGMKPMIAADMYFRLSNPEQDYYNLTCQIPEEVQNKIPKNVQLVYWDYYHEDAEFYSSMIQRYRDINFEPIMFSGIWTWTRMWYDHQQTKDTVIPCIKACRKAEVKELIFTMWGDDGGYCNYDSALAGIVYSGNLAYGVKPNDTQTMDKRFAAICGGYFEANIATGSIQATLTNGDKKYTVATSMMLWDDPLMGIYFAECLRHDPKFDQKIVDHYQKLLLKLQKYQDNKAAGDFEYILNVLDLLIKKTQMRRALIDTYQKNDRINLRQIAVSVIPSVITAALEFDSSFRAQWLAGAKPFGLETIQIRNAGLITRLEETALRIREYLDGTVTEIEELEVKMEPCDIFNNPAWYSQICASYIR